MGAQFESIDGIYQNIDKLKGKQKENLVENEEQVRLSKKLATIIQDVPIEFEKQKLIREEVNKTVLADLLSGLGFLVSD